MAVKRYLQDAAVEAKSGERGQSSAIRYFKERMALTRWYQVHLGTKDVAVDGIRVLPFAKLCEEIGLR